MWHANYCILPGSTIWKASYENEKDDKFWFCSRMKIVHYSALGMGLYLECLKNLSSSCSLQNSHLQFNISYDSSLVFRCTVFPLPWKIDAKLGVHLIAKYFGAASSQCLFMIWIDFLLYSKSVDRIFHLTVHMWITKTIYGSFNRLVDIVNFSSYGFLI